MQQSDDITALATALAVFQSEMTPVDKASNNPFFKSKYADLSTVMKEAMPLTSKNGISIVQFPGLLEGDEVLYTQLMHKSGQWMRSCMKLHLTKNDAQGQGSALTYAKRYAAMAALGIVADEDDDGNAASKPKQKPVAKPQVVFASKDEITDIRLAACEVTGLVEESEVDAWLKEKNIDVTKLPKAWVKPALEKISKLQAN